MPLFQLLQGYTDPVYILQISPLVIGVWLNGHEIISHGPDFGQYPFTITLKSGRREANISINIIPSIDPIGWFETVAKAPSGR